MSDLAVCEGKLICQMTGDDLRSEVKRLRRELEAIAVERDLLRRQVEALANEIERPPENYPYHYDDWRELLWYERVEWWVKWSLEQAKKGGGND